MTGLIFHITHNSPKDIDSPKLITKIDYDKLNNLLRYEAWESVYALNDVEQAYSLFINIFQKYVGMSTSVIRSNSRKTMKLKPWISLNLVKQIDLKNKLGRKLSKHPQNLSLKQRYKNLANSIKRDIPKIRDNYYKSKFTNCAGDIKKQWQTINEFTNQPAKCPQGISLKIENNIITEKSEVANEFNKYFGSVSSLRTADYGPCSNFSINEDRPSSNSFVFNRISAIEIVGIINSLNNSKSRGIDGISNSLLKKVAFNVSDILAHLFNRSILTGVFPNDFKNAIVIPLFKKGERQNTQNYRPISLLPTLSKVFEKAIKVRMMRFLIKTNFLSPKQFGFRKKLSTEDALLEFCSFLLKGLDSKKNCACLFVDIKKAFDMVDHNILLRKLYKIGFRGNIHLWFSSYLKQRSQRVKIDDVLSEPIEIALGVPQGSVLGPILFLVYINSIFSQNMYGNITAFADDLGIVYSSKTSFDLICEINHDIDVLRKWFTKHKLIISDKTKLMFVNFTAKDPPDFNFYYHDPCCNKFKNSIQIFNNNTDCNQNCFKIECVDNFKYLGVIIDNRLNWDLHTASLKIYFRCVLRKFYQLSRVCSPEVLKVFYFGIFHSKLNYGISCWGGAYENKIKPLLILQKSVIRRLSLFHQQQSSYHLFQSFNILPVRHLFYFKVLKTVFRNKSSYQPRDSYYSLRSIFVNSNLEVPVFRTTIYRNSFPILSCRLFNILPNHIKNENSEIRFLRNMKSWLLNFNFAVIENLLNPQV